MTVKSPDIALARVHVVGVCRRCRHYHGIDLPPDLFGRAAFDWEWKHRLCEREKPGSVEFLSPSRFIPRGFDDRVYEDAGQAPWWLDWRHNADIKLAYAADATFTITLASLGSSTTFVAGREATSVSNGTNKYLDYEITGKITTGTTPTADREIRVYGVKPVNDTPTWPDVFDGTDSAETVSSVEVLEGFPLAWSKRTNATSDHTYPVVNASTLAQLWGLVPDNFTLFVAHSTAVALNATGSNHELSYRGAYATST